MRIAILCGGNTSERVISLKSGRCVHDAIKDEYETADLIEISELDEVEQVRKYDAVFIAIHGGFGENGDLQKRLADMGVQFTGPGSDASRKCHDRFAAKEVFTTSGIPTPQYTTSLDLGRIPESIRLVIKPRQGGSSIGVAVIDRARLSEALSSYEYKEYIVEEFIGGKELTIGYLGNTLLPAVEIRYKGDLFDYDAKYISDQTQYLIPAEIDKTTERLIYDYSDRIIKSFGIEHMARIDLRLDKTDLPYFLEVNTVPGLTSRSLLPMAAKAAGIDYKSLCKTLINLALQRAS